MSLADGRRILRPEFVTDAAVPADLSRSSSPSSSATGGEEDFLGAVEVIPIHSSFRMIYDIPLFRSRAWTLIQTNST